MFLFPFHVSPPYGVVAGWMDSHLFFAGMPSSTGAVFQIKLPSSSSFLAKLSDCFIIIGVHVALLYTYVWLASSFYMFCLVYLVKK